MPFLSALSSLASVAMPACHLATACFACVRSLSRRSPAVSAAWMAASAAAACSGCPCFWRLSSAACSVAFASVAYFKVDRSSLARLHVDQMTWSARHTAMHIQQHLDSCSRTSTALHCLQDVATPMSLKSHSKANTWHCKLVPLQTNSLKT